MSIKKFIDKIKIKNKAEKIENFIKENNKKLRQETEKLNLIISENYDIMTGIGEKEYLWNILSYKYYTNIKYKYKKKEGYVDNTEDSNLNCYLEKLNKKSTKKITSENLDIRDVNSISSCSAYLEGIENTQDVIFVSKILGKISLDDYIEYNGKLPYFLDKQIGRFSIETQKVIEEFEIKKFFDEIKKIENRKEKGVDIQQKTKKFSDEILKRLNDEQIRNIIEIFKRHTHDGLNKIFRRDKNKIVKINFVPYSKEIIWSNSGGAHHFSLIRYLLKNRSTIETFTFKSDLSKFTLYYLENDTINKLFDDVEIFLLPYDNELLNILRSLPKIKIRTYYEIKIKYPYKLKNGQKIEDTTKNFSFSFVVLLKEEEIHKNLIKILNENNFYNLKEYYKKYLKEQDENLKSYIKKGWIKEEEIEKIKGLELS